MEDNPNIALIRMLNDRVSTVESTVKQVRKDAAEDVRSIERRLRALETAMARLITLGSILLLALSMFGDKISEILFG
jgi:uncharacterized protein YlxW (UPF0749 family)